MYFIAKTRKFEKQGKNQPFADINDFELRSHYFLRNLQVIHELLVTQKSVPELEIRPINGILEAFAGWNSRIIESDASAGAACFTIWNEDRPLVGSTAHQAVFALAMLFDTADESEIKQGMDELTGYEWNVDQFRLLMARLERERVLTVARFTTAGGGYSIADIVDITELSKATISRFLTSEGLPKNGRGKKELKYSRAQFRDLLQAISEKARSEEDRDTAIKALLRM